MKRYFIALITDPLFLFKFIYFFCFYLICRISGKRVLVYNLHHDYFFDIFKAIYEELKRDKRIVLFFSYKFDRLHLKKYLLRNVSLKYLVPSHVSPFIPYELFVTAEVTGPDFPLSMFSTRTMEIYHGTGVYDLYQMKAVLQRFDVHFAIGEQFLSLIEYLYGDKEKKPTVYEVGYPKTDDLFKRTAETDGLATKYGIGERKTVLFASHWNPASAIHRYGEDIIKALAELDIQVLIKPHHYLFVKYKDDNWQEQLKQLAEQYTNVIYVDYPNTQALFPLADILVTDPGTTALYEFSLLDKPVVMFNDRSWFKDNSEYIETEQEIADIAFNYSSLEELQSIIKNIILPDEEMKKKISEQQLKQKQLVSKYFYNPGKSVDYAVSAITKELGL
jgi:hypothetical protein